MNGDFLFTYDSKNWFRERESCATRGPLYKTINGKNGITNTVNLFPVSSLSFFFLLAPDPETMCHSKGSVWKNELEMWPPFANPHTGTTSPCK